MWRLTPSFAIEDGYAEAFAPGFEIADGFPEPDQVIDDLRAMTYTAFRDASEANSVYIEEMPLNERLSQVPVPLLSIFGAEDQICDPEVSQEAYSAVPGARVAEVEDAGHSPNVEQPEETARLILEFAADAGDEVLAPAPESAAGAAKGKARKGRENEEIKGKGRKAREKEETQEQAPNADKNTAGEGGDGAPNAEKGQKPPSDERPGGD